MTREAAQTIRETMLEGDSGSGVGTFRMIVTDILQAAIGATGAAFGNVQIFDPRHGGLEIVAQLGFPQEFLDLFARVTPAGPSSTACARAFRQGRRVMIPDVELDLEFEPYRPIARTCGFKAVQSTPIMQDGRVVGVLSTHFAERTELPPESAQLLDRYAAVIARLMRDHEDRFGEAGLVVEAAAAAEGGG